MFWNLVIIKVSTGSLSETLGWSLTSLGGTWEGDLIVEPSVMPQMTYISGINKDGSKTQWSFRGKLFPSGFQICGEGIIIGLYVNLMEKPVYLTNF